MLKETVSGVIYRRPCVNSLGGTERNANETCQDFLKIRTNLL